MGGSLDDLVGGADEATREEEGFIMYIVFMEGGEGEVDREGVSYYVTLFMCLFVCLFLI